MKKRREESNGIITDKVKAAKMTIKNGEYKISKMVKKKKI